MADLNYQFVYETPTKILVVGVISSNLADALGIAESAVAGTGETGDLLGETANEQAKPVERLDV